MADILIKFFFNFLSFLFQILVRIFYPPSLPIAPPTEKSLQVTIDLSQPLAEISDKYLSFAIDTAEIVGGHRWHSSGSPIDLTQKKLLKLAAALSPAYLRVGGTDADRVIFDNVIKKKNTLTLTRQIWDNLNSFVYQTGLKLFFTIDAGPSVRDRHGQWQSENLESLLHYSKKRGYKIEAFEFGNEINAFWFFHGFYNRITVRQYIDDFKKFKRVVKKYFPYVKVGGPATIYWPRVGEAFSLVGPITSAFIKSGIDPDMFTWHYYPQQSKRCPIAFPKAKPGLLLNPQNLNDIGKWAMELTALKKHFNPQAEMWLGEVGHALCGGQPGISDTFESSLWWTDVLGLMATKGQSIVVRQDLIGAYYSLLDKQTLNPLPDFWASLLWKKLMGTQVLKVSTSADNPYIRTYAHHTNARSDYRQGAVTIVFINLQNKKNSIKLKNVNTVSAVIYQLTAKSLNEKSVLLNGTALVLIDDAVPVLKGQPIKIKNKNLDLVPLSITYLVFPYI